MRASSLQISTAVSQNVLKRFQSQCLDQCKHLKDAYRLRRFLPRRFQWILCLQTHKYMREEAMYGEPRTLYYAGRTVSEDLSERLHARGWKIEYVNPAKQ